MPNINRDIASIVYAQLPTALRDKLSVTLNGDPYGIRVMVVFATEDKRTWSTSLEDMDFQGVPLRCKVPDTFIAHLCVVV